MQSGKAIVTAIREHYLPGLLQLDYEFEIPLGVTHATLLLDDDKETFPVPDEPNTQRFKQSFTIEAPTKLKPGDELPLVFYEAGEWDLF
jgi:hypothetical protein